MKHQDELNSFGPHNRKNILAILQKIKNLDEIELRDCISLPRDTMISDFKIPDDEVDKIFQLLFKNDIIKDCHIDMVMHYIGEAEKIFGKSYAFLHGDFVGKCTENCIFVKVKISNKFNDLLNNLEDKCTESDRFFWFDGNLFFLKKSDGGTTSLAFREGGDAPYHLFSAMIELLKFGNQEKGSNGVWLSADVNRAEIVEIIKNKTNIKQTDWNSWIRFTRHNLNTKISTQSFSHFVKISTYQPKINNGSYNIKLKLPIL